MTVSNRKKSTIYAICVSFFILAGIFQATDSLLPEFWHALFALSAHTILISLVVAWGVSLVHRMARKDLLAYFLTVASLILFFLVARMIKYGLTRDVDTLSRYLWYSYYVPQCLIPPTILLAAASVENKNGKPLSAVWYLIYLPAIILIILIYTNDIHNLAFSLDFGGGDFSYKHRPVFYLALIWEIAVTLVSLAVLFFKCRVSACKSRTKIPVITFISCGLFSTVCFLTDFSAFKIPELLCFTCITSVESCILIGLIPSNENYDDFFSRSAYSAIIADENFNAVYSSETPPQVTRKLLKAAAISPVLSSENTRLSAKKIHGGYAFFAEDLTKINEINAALEETNERISEENYLIEAENELKEQQTRINEQNRLFLKTEEYTKGEQIRLENLLNKLKTDCSDDSDFIKKMRLACVLAAYIKRRSNLVMLSEKQNSIDFGELSLAIRESLDYLSLIGVESSYSCDLKGETDGETLGVFYDFFEESIVTDPLPSAVIIRLCKIGDDITLNIESDETNVYTAEFSNNLIEKFSDVNRKVSIKTDGDAVYYSVSVCKGGEV